MLAEELGRHLQYGQSIFVQVVELLSSQHLIVEWRGHLFRIKDSTDRSWTVGEWIELEVQAVDPPRFRISQMRKI